MVTLMERMERGEIVSAESSKEMIELMKREQGQNAVGRAMWRLPKATKSGALDLLRSNVGIIYSPKGRIAVAVTVDDMPEPVWTPDNPAFHLMSRLSEILIDGLGKR
jgi:beta-lactamase class A